MSYPINQKINPYQQQTPMGVNSINAPQLQLQNVTPDDVTDGITENTVLKGIQNDSDDQFATLKTAAATVPVWAAMAYGMQKFNEACSGGEKENLLYKVGAWGEKVGSQIEKQFPFIKKALDRMQLAKECFFADVVPTSKILSAFFNTPAKPISKMAAMMSNSAKGSEVASDAVQKFEKYIEHGGELFLDGKKLSLADVKTLAEDSHTPENIQKIIKICQSKDLKEFFQSKTLGKIPFSRFFTGQQRYLSDFIPSLAEKLNRKVYFSEYVNKLKAFNNGNKSYLGQKLPKAMLRTIEGITNGTAGGKFAILMAAYFIGDSIIKTMKAPKGNGEKGKTFAENNLYNLGWYLTMPLGLGIMYKTGGLKYLGLDKAKVEAYRKELADFNEKVSSGLLNDKAAYQAEKKASKLRIKGIFKSSEISIAKNDKFGTNIVKSLKNIIYKPLQLAGRILDTGLEKHASFNPEGIDKTSNLLQKVKQFIFHDKSGKTKGFAGGAIRFAIFMAVISPFLAKFFAKGSHLIFGKPTKSVLDEDKEPEKKQEITIPQQTTPQQPVMQHAAVPQPSIQQAIPVQQAAPAMKPLQQKMNLDYNQTASRENLIDMYNKTTPTIEKTMITSTPDEPTRRYIPSSEGVKLDAKIFSQDDKANKAMDKANQAEKLANRYI